MHRCFRCTRTATALDKDRPATLRQQSKSRPLAHFRLGDKDARHGGSVQQNIQIAEVVGNNETGLRCRTFYRERNREPAQYKSTRCAHPLCALRKRQSGLPQTQPPIPHKQLQKCEQKEDKPQSAAEKALYCSSSSRNRFLAAGVSCRRSSSVRKSIVPNSRSHAGSPQIRAPTPIYVFSSLGILGVS